MKKNEPVSKIAATNLITISVERPLSEVRRLLKENGIHHMPVISGKKLVGMISSSDILALAFDSQGTNDQALDSILDHQFSIETVMQKELSTLKETDSIRTAAEALSEGHFHSLPLVNDSGDLVGLITSTDLIRYLLSQY